jgi:O-antigen biosynthesis protein
MGDDHTVDHRDVVVVAKTRDVARAAVLDAIAAGLRPSIFGTGWDAFVDPALVVRDYVPNEELPAVYSAATVVLADHWDAMREWGFVSNRIFDVLACGTAVVSDDLPEIRRLFGDAVPTYADPAQLRTVVDALRTDPGTPSRVARGREIVLTNHTFDHRATELVTHLDRVRTRAVE